MSRWVLILVAFGCQILLAAAETSITVEGYVTTIVSPVEFKVDRINIRCMASMDPPAVHNRKSLAECPDLWIGERLVVHGYKDKSGVVTATAFETVAPADRAIDGSAVIDRIVHPADTAGIMVSADGYTILVPASVHPAFEEPLTSQTPVTTNLWLKYSGTQRADGVVVAKTAAYSLNVLKGRERKVNEKEEFDPSSVKESDRQSKLSMSFKGRDPKRFPAAQDAEMQKRVESIGNKLVPAYQRDLPSSDPSKIDFRFQVVEEPKLHDALTLSNGIILVPRHIVARMQNDSQLATVLADNIACALEKQTLRLIPARRGEAAGNVALLVGGAFVPGLGFASLLQSGATESVMQRRSEEQSGRVSLVLLREAGFNIDEAPETWWLISAKNKPLDAIAMPYRAKYLYGILGTTWRAPRPPAPTPLPAAQ